MVILAAMFPIFKDLYDYALEFIPHSSLLSFRGLVTDEGAQVDPSTPGSLTLVASHLGRQSQDTCTCRSSSVSGLTLPSSMRRELDVMKNELSRSQREVAKLEERCKVLEKTLWETKEILREKDGEIERLKREHSLGGRRRSDGDQKQRFVYSVQDGWAENRSRIADDSKSIKGAAFEKTETMPTVDEQHAQARSFETFFTKIDLWSGAQVIQAVRDLNSEILQFAASASEICAFDKQSRSSSRLAQASNDTQSRLGPHLTRLLMTRDHAQDPMLVQLALQGCASSCIARALKSSFCMGFSSKNDVVLAGIYSHMYHSEPQPSSSRWRALTHRYIHNLHPGLEEHAVNDLGDTIFRWCSDIFLTSGCVNPDTTPSLLRTRFSNQVQRIARAVCKVAQVTREDIMSTNFDVVSVDYGQAYDGQRMSDAFGDYGTSRGAVLCTTELGLKCTTRKGGGELGKMAEDSTIEGRLLLQPKVVLESVMDFLDPR